MKTSESGSRTTKVAPAVYLQQIVWGELERHQMIVARERPKSTANAKAPPVAKRTCGVAPPELIDQKETRRTSEGHQLRYRQLRLLTAQGQGEARPKYVPAH
jgi:hypothetical protein